MFCLCLLLLINTMMRFRFFISCLFLPIVIVSYSQEGNKFGFFAGYGYYEGVNIGSVYNFCSNNHSVGLSFGFDKVYRKHNYYLAGAIEYNVSIFRSRVTRFKIYKWNLDGRIVFWHYEDDDYVFRALSFVPNVRRQFSLCEKLSLSVDAGPAFNLVLYSKRKTFEEVGWPYNVMPNMRVLFIF